MLALAARDEAAADEAVDRSRHRGERHREAVGQLLDRALLELGEEEQRLHLGEGQAHLAEHAEHVRRGRPVHVDAELRRGGRRVVAGLQRLIARMQVKHTHRCGCPHSCRAGGRSRYRSASDSARTPAGRDRGARRLLARGDARRRDGVAVGRQPTAQPPRPDDRRRLGRRVHARRLPAHLGARRRGRRGARPRLVHRRPRADAADRRRRPALRPRRAARRRARARPGAARRRGGAAGRPARRRDRQPARVRELGDRRRRLRARPLAADPLGPRDARRRRRHPDRRRAQPGQLRRRARRRARPGGGDQHRGRGRRSRARRAGQRDDARRSWRR